MHINLSIAATESILTSITYSTSFISEMEGLTVDIDLF